MRSSLLRIAVLSSCTADGTAFPIRYGTTCLVKVGATEPNDVAYHVVDLPGGLACLRPVGPGLHQGHRRDRQRASGAPREARTRCADTIPYVQLTVRPLTPELWPLLEDLFGTAGASNGCWCMYWRIGPAYRTRPRDQNKAALRDLTEQGPPPGLLACDGDLAVGWCQVAPRAALAWLASRPWGVQPDDNPVWSISCFYVRRGYRRRGVTSALIAAALQLAKRASAPVVEAYPVDTAAPKSTSNVYTGTASTFKTLGFTTVGAAPHGRVIMRYDLR